MSWTNLLLWAAYLIFAALSAYYVATRQGDFSWPTAALAFLWLTLPLIIIYVRKAEAEHRPVEKPK